MSDKLARLTAIITDKLGVAAENVTLNANFEVDLGADSLDQVELIMAFEDEFAIDIPDEAADGIKTVKEALDYIEKKAA